MRAREFITEKKAKIHPDHKSALGPSMVYPDMDAGYDYYRYMNVVAAHPHHKAPHDHDHFRDHPDRKSTRLNSSHVSESRMPSSA